MSFTVCRNSKDFRFYFNFSRNGLRLPCFFCLLPTDSSSDFRQLPNRATSIKLCLQFPNIPQGSFSGNTGNNIFRSIFLVFKSLWTPLFFQGMRLGVCIEHGISTMVVSVQQKSRSHQTVTEKNIFVFQFLTTVLLWCTELIKISIGT